MTVEEFYEKKDKTQWEWENLVVRTSEKPFLCGGYTQMDWDALNGAFIDMEYVSDYCADPIEAYHYLVGATSQKWMH